MRKIRKDLVSEAYLFVGVTCLLDLHDKNSKLMISILKTKEKCIPRSHKVYILRKTFEANDSYLESRNERPFRVLWKYIW